MFCMNCGQQLPNGAKFCLECGTPQGTASPANVNQAETINLDGMHSFVPAVCPNCTAHMKVDTSLKVARCDSCGTECLVQDAVKALNVRGNVQVGNATINVCGSNVDSLLKRVEMMLEDGKFDEVISKCDAVLDLDPTNGIVYFYMLMAVLHCRNREEFAADETLCDRYKVYAKAIKYGDDELKNELQCHMDKVYARYEANLNNPQIGDPVVWGHNSNGKRIIWTVLNVYGDKALLISYDSLFRAKYHEVSESVNWENCSLRKLLNQKKLLNLFFSAEEQNKMLPRQMLNDKNNSLDGVPLDDKVFLLSGVEVCRYIMNKSLKVYSFDFWLRQEAGQSNNSSSILTRESSELICSHREVREEHAVNPVIFVKLGL